MQFTVTLIETAQYTRDVEADSPNAAIADVRAGLTLDARLAGSPAHDAAAGIAADAADLGKLLDECDAAAEGDSNDTEIETLQATVETAVNLLKRLGITIPRAPVDDDE